MSPLRQFSGVRHAIYLFLYRCWNKLWIESPTPTDGFALFWPEELLYSDCSMANKVTVFIVPDRPLNDQRLIESTLYYVNISVLIKLRHISVIASYCINFIHDFHIQKLLILHKRKINKHKTVYRSTINGNIEKQANGMFINTYPSFSPFLLYFRCKLGVTFARRCVSVMVAN